MTDYDAVLWLSFGGPEGPDDVLPFLQNVTRGRGIRRSNWWRSVRTTSTSAVSRQSTPRTARWSSAMERELAKHGIDLPVYFGNRNWHPMLADTLRAMLADGRRRVLVLVSSAYASYSGCRQYRENLADAVAKAEVGEVMTFDKVRHYFDHPGFIGPMVDATVAALRALPQVDESTRFVSRPTRFPLRRPRRQDRQGGTTLRPAGPTWRSTALWPRWWPPRRRGRWECHWRGTWCSSPGPGRRRCRGWSRTSATTCRW